MFLLAGISRSVQVTYEVFRVPAISSSDANLWQMTFPANAVHDSMHTLNTSLVQCRPMKSPELYRGYVMVGHLNSSHFSLKAMPTNFQVQ